MDRWREQLRGCWDTVALQLPALQSSLTSLTQSLGLGSIVGGPGTAVGEIYELRGRRLQVVRQLGEGGYSFVYLVRQLGPSTGPTSSTGGGLLDTCTPQLFALKRVLCGSEEQLREAEHEVEVMRRLRHPCLLPLLEAATQQQRTPDGATRHVVLMLFPVYDEGNLFDFIQQQPGQPWDHALPAGQQRGQGPQHARHAAAPAAAAAQQAARQQLVELLRIFLQVCAALHAMHSQLPALAHRDVKPHNVLLRRRQPAQHGQRRQQQQHTVCAGGLVGSSGGEGAAWYDPAPPLEAPQEDQSPRRRQQQEAPEKGWAARGWQAEPGGGAASPAAAAEEAAEAAAVIAVEHEGQAQREAGERWWAERLGGWRQRYEAVLMDFGSTRPALVEVATRRQAMAVQEDAERQCTAPYRAPELWDVPSACTIDERVDVWSLGCLLYFMLCQQSPFERAAGEAGGSLMLAVVNGRLGWPEDVGWLPESLKQLVRRCLDTDPATRPRVAEVAAQADRILAALLLQ